MAKKILIVDDDSASRNLLQSFLSAKGFEVDISEDGIAGLEKAKSGFPSLIVLDVMMPRMDGYGFLREIKKDASLRNIPIVVLTAREMMRDVFLQEGIKDFIVKPHGPEELFKILLKYL